MALLDLLRAAQSISWRFRGRERSHRQRIDERSEVGTGLLIDVGRDSLEITSSCKSAGSEEFGDSKDGFTEGKRSNLFQL